MKIDFKLVCENLAGKYHQRRCGTTFSLTAKAVLEAVSPGKDILILRPNTPCSYDTLRLAVDIAEEIGIPVSHKKRNSVHIGNRRIFTAPYSRSRDASFMNSHDFDVIAD